MRIAFLVAIVFLGGAYGRSVTVVAEQAEPCSATALAASTRKAVGVLDLLHTALIDRAGVARLYYQAYAPVCPTDYWGELPFPEIRTHKPPKNEVGVAAIRDALRGNPGVTVTHDPTGMDRVTIGTVPDDILRTRIANISLSTDAQFNSFDAIGEILSSKEVVEAIRVHGYVWPSRVHQGLTQQPMPGVPHLHSSMRNVTVDQALDMVATTFKGIVTYATCSKPRQLVVDFVYRS